MQPGSFRDTLKASDCRQMLKKMWSQDAYVCCDTHLWHWSASTQQLYHIVFFFCLHVRSLRASTDLFHSRRIAGVMDCDKKGHVPFRWAGSGVLVLCLLARGHGSLVKHLFDTWARRTTRCYNCVASPRSTSPSSYRKRQQWLIFFKVVKMSLRDDVGDLLRSCEQMCVKSCDGV